MFKTFTVRMLAVSIALCMILLQTHAVYASPFGQGVFGANVPFGSETSLSIALGGNVSMTLTPSGSNFTGTGSHTITVTSTDVVGYYLYIYSPTSTAMSSGTDTIPTSSNVTPGSLAVNTWGYNTNASSNFVGVKTTPVLLKMGTGPFKNGDSTTVTYGVLAGPTKSAGNYSTSVVYTAVPRSE